MENRQHSTFNICNTAQVGHGSEIKDSGKPATPGESKGLRRSARLRETREKLSPIDFAAGKVYQGITDSTNKTLGELHELRRSAELSKRKRENNASASDFAPGELYESSKELAQIVSHMSQEDREPLKKIIKKINGDIQKGKHSSALEFMSIMNSYLKDTKAVLDTPKRTTSTPTTYHYNPLQITEEQMSLIQIDIIRGNMESKHILDTAVSIGRYNEMSYAFSGEQKLATQINYAIKSQSNEHLLQDLILNGLAKEKVAGQSRFGLDAASQGEIEKCINAAKTLGIDAGEICSRITLSNPNMDKTDMDYALTNGVRSFVVHNQLKLKELHTYAKNLGVVGEVEIITRIPGPPKANKTGGDKFGADLDTCESMLQYSKDQGMQPKGMAVHVGWQVDSAEQMEQGMRYAFDKMARTFQNVKDKYGIELSVLDLGGGWPNQFRGKPVPSINENASTVRKLMDEYFTDLGSKKPTLILEPGNYLSAAAGVTKANITNIDKVPDKPRMLRCVLNIGRFHGGLVDEHYPVSMIVDGKVVEAFISLPEESQHSVVIYGPSCDTTDLVMGDITFSDNPEVRRRLEQVSDASNVHKAHADFQLPIILHGTGAYTTEYTVGKVGERGFNSIPNPELVIISQGRVIGAGVSQTSPEDTIS